LLKLLRRCDLAVERSIGGGEGDRDRGKGGHAIDIRSLFASRQMEKPFHPNLSKESPISADFHLQQIGNPLISLMKVGLFFHF